MIGYTHIGHQFCSFTFDGFQFIWGRCCAALMAYCHLTSLIKCFPLISNQHNFFDLSSGNSMRATEIYITKDSSKEPKVPFFYGLLISSCHFYSTAIGRIITCNLLWTTAQLKWKFPLNRKVKHSCALFFSGLFVFNLEKEIYSFFKHICELQPLEAELYPFTHYPSTFISFWMTLYEDTSTNFQKNAQQKGLQSWR